MRQPHGAHGCLPPVTAHFGSPAGPFAGGGPFCACGGGPGGGGGGGGGALSCGGVGGGVCCAAGPFTPGGGPFTPGGGPGGWAVDGCVAGGGWFTTAGPR